MSLSYTDSYNYFDFIPSSLQEFAQDAHRGSESILLPLTNVRHRIDCITASHLKFPAVLSEFYKNLTVQAKLMTVTRLYTKALSTALFSGWQQVSSDLQVSSLYSKQSWKKCVIWSYGNQIWPIKWNAVSSRQRSYRYCCMNALLGR